MFSAGWEKKSINQLFYGPLENIWLISRRHHCRWRAVNLGLYLALRVFEHGGIFLVPHLLWHEASVFPVSFEWPPHLITSYCWWRAGKLRPMLGIQGLWAGKDLYCATYAVTRGLSFPSLVQWTAPFSHLLRHARGVQGKYSNQDPQVLWIDF